MNISHIEHIGIAVKDLEASITFYENILGMKCYAIEDVREQKVRTAFFRIGDSKIELLESTDTDGPIARFIEKRGEGIHHIAFAVDQAGKALDELQEKGVQLVDQAARAGAEGLLIGFLHPRSTFGVLMELCSDK